MKENGDYEVATEEETKDTFNINKKPSADNKTPPPPVSAVIPKPVATAPGDKTPPPPPKITPAVPPKPVAVAPSKPVPAVPPKPEITPMPQESKVSEIKEPASATSATVSNIEPINIIGSAFKKQITGLREEIEVLKKYVDDKVKEVIVDQNSEKLIREHIAKAEESLDEKVEKLQKEITEAKNSVSEKDAMIKTMQEKILSFVDISKNIDTHIQKIDNTVGKYMEKELKEEEYLKKLARLEEFSPKDVDNDLNKLYELYEVAQKRVHAAKKDMNIVKEKLSTVLREQQSEQIERLKEIERSHVVTLKKLQTLEELAGIDTPTPEEAELISNLKKKKSALEREIRGQKEILNLKKEVSDDKATAASKPATPASADAGKTPVKTIKCPKCKSNIDIFTEERPVKIECNKCGAKGVIKT